MTIDQSKHTDDIRAMTIVSPACCGEEIKDQDRANWCAAALTATVCDGVSTSPRASRAAEIASVAAPVLFLGDMEDRMKVLADLLVVQRLELQRQGIATPAHMPAAMRSMLEEVCRQNLARSYQTTLVSANFIPAEDRMMVHLVSCGDSAFLAFSPGGQLLFSSLNSTEEAEAKNITCSPYSQPIRFGPGDELLTQIIGDFPPDSSLAGWADYAGARGHQWTICRAITCCNEISRSPDLNKLKTRTLWLKPGDLLLVPNYLCGIPRDPQYREYRRFCFSSLIRPLTRDSQPGQVIHYSGRSATTSVLPDHVYQGHWQHIQEQFPPDTHFILCTDGFYGGFTDSTELWTWLRTNEKLLNSPENRKEVMEQLHRKLHASIGDDDISFVWVFTRNSHDTP